VRAISRPAEARCNGIWLTAERAGSQTAGSAAATGWNSLLYFDQGTSRPASLVAAGRNHRSSLHDVDLADDVTVRNKQSRAGTVFSIPPGA